MKKLHLTLFLPLTTMLWFSAPPTLQAEEKLVESVVAVVDDKPILLSEFEQAWRIQKSSFQGAITDEKALKKRLIEHLVMIELQSKSAKKNGIRVNERELNASIDVLAQRNNLSLKELYNQAAKQGLSIQAFRQNIRQQLIAQRLQNQMFAGRVQVSDAEVNEVLSREHQLNDPMQYRFKTLLIQPKENNKRSWEKAQEVINKIHQDVQSRQSFDEAVALYSDSNDGFNNSHLQWRDSTSIPDLFHKVLLKLDKGQISKPIKTGRGLFLLQLTDKQFKQKVESYQYQLEQILLATVSYSEEEADSIEKIIQQQLSENPNAFVDLARKYSKDHYAQSGGQTGWLKASALEPLLAAQLSQQKIDNNLHKFFSQQQGRLLYRLIDRKSYDASAEVTREQIKQRLAYLKVQAEYEEFLRHLRLRSAVQIYF